MRPQGRRARPQIDDSRIRIRTRYLEAIRTGANIHDATEYANSSPKERPKFIPINVEIPVAPKGYGKPGEGEQLLPKGWVKGSAPVIPVVTDSEIESVKRPMAESPVSATVETVPVAEIPEIQIPSKTELPIGWDTIDYPWQNLRDLCVRVTMKTPHSRTDGVKAIRKALEL